jgi:hypothetical protein
MKLACLALAATLAAASAPALANPSEPTSPATDGKDPTTALTLSLGGTLVSAGMMGYALHRLASRTDSYNDSTGVTIFDIGLFSTLITPSLGQFYAGNYLSTGLVIRGAGAAVAAVGAVQAIGCVDSSTSCNDGKVALAIGAGVVAVGAIWDIVDAPRAANRWNLKHVQLAPVSVGTGSSVGLGVSGQF